MTYRTIFSFCSRESKVSLFSLCGQQFPRYRPIFKLVIFEHETWPLAKVPEVAHILSSYPRGSKMSLLLLYRERFLRYRPFFKITILWAWNFAICQSSRSCTYNLLPTPGFRKWAYFCFMTSGFWNMGRFSKLRYVGMKLWVFFALQTAVSEILANFQNLPYLDMKLGHCPKFQKFHVYTLSTRKHFPRYRSISKFQKLHRYSLATQGVKSEFIFALWTAISEIQADFQTSHIWAWNLAIGQSSRSCTYTLFLSQGFEN